MLHALASLRCCYFTGADYGDGDDGEDHDDDDNDYGDDAFLNGDKDNNYLSRYWQESDSSTRFGKGDNHS